MVRVLEEGVFVFTVFPLPDKNGNNLFTDH